MNCRRPIFLRALLVVGVLALAAWVRLDNVREAMFQGELLPQIDSDSAYHYHRILDAVRNFPHVPMVDPWMAWPRGGRCPWAQGFDLAAAAWVKLLGGGRSSHLAAVLAGIWPVLMGLLAVAATMSLAYRLAPRQHRTVAWGGAGLVVALLPESLFQSRFGRIDHHVFELLLVVLLTRWALKAMPGRQEEPGRGWRFELEGALLVALGVWFFTGSTLYVAMAAGLVMVAALAAPGRARLLGSGAPGLLAGALLSAVLSWPALAGGGALLSFMFPSMLQPVLVAIAGGGVAAAVAVNRLSPGRGLGRRVALLAATCVALLAAVGLLAAPLWREVYAGLHGWLFHQDRWISTIGEFQPLFGKRFASGGTWRAIHAFFGWAGFFVPMALPLATWWIGRERRWHAFAFAAMLVAFIGLTVLQTRFSRVATPFIAIGIAVTFQAIVSVLGERLRFLVRFGSAVGLASLLALALADPPTRLTLYPARSRGPDPFLLAAMDFRDAGPVVAGRRPGVAAPWTWGHWIEVLGHRPVVTNGFGTYVEEAGFWEMEHTFDRGSEAELVALMDRRDLGYVLSGALTVAPSDPASTAKPLVPLTDGMLSREFMTQVPLSPLVIAGSGVPAMGARHLEHFLPRFASHQVIVGVVFALPAVWTYERVAGATLAGSAPPGTRVEADLDFRENGRPHVWKAWADADRSGRFAITVPVPTGWMRPTLSTAPRWRISAGGGAATELEVPEAAVREGRRVEVGALRAPPAKTASAG
ncbi:MAG TPA: hypothetical protein VFE30_14170 [Anaeromyxobacteraceae bacterium]|nr:hypothetical protein [Anaeromyxobacteraceae bacterium]